MDSGLENIVAAETVLSDVDGQNGRLVIRGWPVELLSASMAFEDTAHLLWEGFFEDLRDVSSLGRQLGEAREAAFAIVSGIPDGLDSVSFLRAGWALLPDDESLETAIRLAGSAPVLTAAAIRRGRGEPPIAPNAQLSQSADFLHMLTGKVPHQAEARALDAYLVTVCDHGLNASTFAARVVASTRAGLTSAAIAGISALKGPLHGGAPGPVLDMLDAIGVPENAERWIDEALARNERLMGFGHRVYRVRDPRADALKTALARLPGTSGRIGFAEHIERAVLGRLAEKYPRRTLETNVEFYTALLLEALGLPREAFTAVFACGRIIGWTAHAREQIGEGRLVRPRSVYRGPVPEAA
ncbi:citrate synthase family protein [Hyphomonas neptunium ATCC 15444]|uniref:Citrate synthase n=2 Tax=Hyphomonas TaxID=85 RepID=Q0BWL8_HYPNA|nr:MULTISPECIES: citrate synthase/methylcitrate synthase [Hyphomonas]ABI76205.1 citrate synthase family protein [Hyphomonas neptunium ATCC 15444]KCZ94700.1 citrate synthase 2 [Hyphomonas hirschiana VP5]